MDNVIAHIDRKYLLIRFIAVLQIFLTFYSVILISWWLWIILSPLYFILAVINVFIMKRILTQPSEFYWFTMILILMAPLVVSKLFFVDAGDGSSHIFICQYTFFTVYDGCPFNVSVSWWISTVSTLVYSLATIIFGIFPLKDSPKL